MSIGRPKMKIPSKSELTKDLVTCKNDQEIADKYGISRVTLTKWKKEKGLFKGGV